MFIRGGGGGGGGKDFFDGTYDEKYPWGGWCKTQISKSTQGSFFVFRWGCGVSNGDFEKYQGTFFTKNDDYFLRNQWKMHIFVYYLAKSFATFVVISKTWNTFQRLNIF